MGSRGSADPTHGGRDGLLPVRGFFPRRREFRLQAPRPHTPAAHMGSRGSADPTHDCGDGLLPVRGFFPRRREFRLQAPRPLTWPDRWGRAAARTLPKRVGTGCCPSVDSSPVIARSVFRHLDRSPCRAALHPPTGPPFLIAPDSTAVSRPHAGLHTDGSRKTKTAAPKWSRRRGKDRGKDYAFESVMLTAL